MNMMKSLCVVFFLTILIAAPARAGVADWGIVAHVTYIEPDNLDEFRFRLDVPSACTGGNGWYLFDARFLVTPTTPQADTRDIIKRFFAVVLAAKLSGQTVAVYGQQAADGSGECVVGFVNLD